MAYFVVYQVLGDVAYGGISNVILRKRHPVEWAANPPSAATEAGLVTALLWWADISDEMIPVAEKWCNIED